MTRENVTLVAEPGNPVLTAPETVTPPPSASGRGGTAAVPSRRPSTRSTTVQVKMKMAAFARSAAATSLKETLPEFIPGFKEEIDYFVKECDFGDGNQRKYFNKYTGLFVFGFYVEKELVNEELLERMKKEWASKDKYWDNRPSEVFEISI